jgi:hypothetical protein
VPGFEQCNWPVAQSGTGALQQRHGSIKQRERTSRLGSPINFEVKVSWTSTQTSRCHYRQTAPHRVTDSDDPAFVFTTYITMHTRQICRGGEKSKGLILAVCQSNMDFPDQAARTSKFSCLSCRQKKVAPRNSLDHNMCRSSAARLGRAMNVSNGTWSALCATRKGDRLALLD